MGVRAAHAGAHSTLVQHLLRPFDLLSPSRSPAQVGTAGSGEFGEAGNTLNC